VVMCYDLMMTTLPGPTFGLFQFGLKKFYS
jgi:hypothetical protein